MTEAVSAADLLPDVIKGSNIADALRRSAEGISADFHALVDMIAAMPPLATDIRIGPADWMPWPKVAAPLDQLQAELDGGGCVIVLIGIQLYWLYSVDPRVNTATVSGVPLVKGSTLKIAIIKRASVNILGRWFISKHGA